MLLLKFIHSTCIAGGFFIRITKSSPADGLLLKYYFLASKGPTEVWGGMSVLQIYEDRITLPSPIAALSITLP